MHNSASSHPFYSILSYSILYAFIFSILFSILSITIFFSFIIFYNSFLYCYAVFYFVLYFTLCLIQPLSTFSILFYSTVCPRSSYPFYIASYFINRVKFLDISYFVKPSLECYFEAFFYRQNKIVSRRVEIILFILQNLYFYHSSFDVLPSSQYNISFDEILTPFFHLKKLKCKYFVFRDFLNYDASSNRTSDYVKNKGRTISFILT